MSSLNAAELFDVKDKVVIVTGGGRGIGKMIADGFVQNGAKVYIASRKLEACQAAAKELNDKGPGICIALKVDLTSEDECKAFADEIIKRESRLDVLVNNSGDGADTPVENTPASVWRETFALNVTSAYLLTRFLLPLLDAAATSSDAARVINVGSVGGLVPQKLNTMVYDSSKAALHHLTRILAAKLAHRPNGGHILVNAITPGYVPSRLTEGVAYVTGKRFEEIGQAIPVGRMGEASDMAGLAIFLASKASAWISGQVITTDGGMVGAAETGKRSQSNLPPCAPSKSSSQYGALNLNNLFDVKGKVIVITGGGRGIGKMMADGFVQKEPNLDACEATAKELNAKGPGKCIPELAEQIAKKESKVDVLINNSGVSWGGDFDHHPESAWNKVLTVNVTSPFHLTKFLLPLLDAASTTSDAARVINVGSVAGLRPQQIDTIAYDTSKAAIHHMTRVLAAKLARRPNGGHILVNAIAPGLVPSKMSKGISGIPIQRFGLDSDMAGLAIFLSSKASGWITGMVIASDGGQVYTMETGVGPSKL
ncbi:NAD(P)-binding domain [Phytophthora cactorum]|nr:NAD(P)-binding domain [Phytophthora cactorum]